MEVWSRSEKGFEKHIMKMITGEEYPEKIGMVGYPGAEAAYVLGHSVDPAYATAGLTLEFYRSFNATKFEAWKFFHKT